ncbi:MAG TPA: hypothetical protein PK095_04110 [Myxococcota bacterium]|nr:hypothetical protein [Myxococcota bacterium]
MFRSLAIAFISTSLSGCLNVNLETEAEEIELVPLVETLPAQLTPTEAWLRAGAVLALLNYPIDLVNIEMGLIETNLVKIKELDCRWRGRADTCEAIQRATVVIQPGYIMVRINRGIRPKDSKVFFEKPESATNVRSILDAQRELLGLILEGPKLDRPVPPTFDGMPVAGRR